MSKRRIVVGFSDTHAGHKLGLMPANVQLLDEDERGQPTVWTPRQTAVQEWLEEHYQQDIQGVKDLAGRDEIIVIHNGDLTWGKRHPEGLISTRDADQLTIAIANMRPWLELKNVKKMRLIYGTQSHEFGEGTAPTLITSQLKALYPKKNIQSLRHGLFAIDGVGFDVAHHGPTGGKRQWTSGNQLRYYLKSLMNDEILRGRTPPKVVLRSHYHGYYHETVRVYGEQEWASDIFITPAYCGMTHYAAQATRSAYLLGCGLIAFEIVDGELRKVHPFWRSVDLRTTEEL